MAIADQLDRLNVLRQNLASALTGKGVTADGTEGLETLVPKVAEIEGTTQVQRYEGTFTRNVSDYREETVVDIGFKPDALILFLNHPVGNKIAHADLPIIFDASVRAGSSGHYIGMCWGYYTNKNGENVSGDDFIVEGRALPTSTGFRVIRTRSYALNWSVTNYNNEDFPFVAIKYT